MMNDQIGKSEYKQSWLGHIITIKLMRGSQAVGPVFAYRYRAKVLVIGFMPLALEIKFL